MCSPCSGNDIEGKDDVTEGTSSHFCDSSVVVSCRESELSTTGPTCVDESVLWKLVDADCPKITSSYLKRKLRQDNVLAEYHYPRCEKSDSPLEERTCRRIVEVMKYVMARNLI